MNVPSYMSDTEVRALREELLALAQQNEALQLELAEARAQLETRGKDMGEWMLRALDEHKRGRLAALLEVREMVAALTVRDGTTAMRIIQEIESLIKREEEEGR